MRLTAGSVGLQAQQTAVSSLLLQPTHGAFPCVLVRLLGCNLLLAAAVSFNIKVRSAAWLPQT